MPPGLRRAISDALRFWGLKNHWEGTFNDGFLIVEWRGREYALTTQPWEVMPPENT